LYRTRQVWRRTNTGIILPSCCSLWWRWMDIQTNGRAVIRYEYGRPCCSKGLSKVNNVHILSITTLDVVLLLFGSCCCVPPLYCCHVPLSISQRYWLGICLSDQRQNIRIEKRQYVRIIFRWGILDHRCVQQSIEYICIYIYMKNSTVQNNFLLCNYNKKINKSFLTSICFGCSFRTTFKLSLKNLYMQLAKLYGVRDLVYMLLICIRS